MNLLSLVVLGLGAGALISVTLMPQRLAVQTAVVSAAGIAGLIPSFGPTPEATTVSIGLSVLLLSVGLIRNGRAVAALHPPVLLLVYIAYSTIAALQDRSIDSSILVIAIGLVMALFAVACAHLATTGSPVLVIVVVGLIALQFAIGFGEEFLGMAGLSPRPDGIDRISGRFNYIAPWLPGRAIGSTASPLVYGTIAAVGTLVGLILLFRTKQLRYGVLVVLSGATLVFSGSRSPILALIVVLLVWAVSTMHRRPPLLNVMGALAVIAILASVDLVALLGFDDSFTTSRSFVHREGVLDSIGALLGQQDLWHTLFGNGAAATSLIGGIVGGVTSVGVYDNQYISEFAKSGVIGLILLVGFLVAGMVRGNGASRLVLLLLAINLFSYDGLTWRLTFMLVVLVAVGPVNLLHDKSSALPEAASDKKPTLRPLAMDSITRH